MSLFDQAIPAASLKQLKRDIMQGVWSLLLNCPDFIDAYTNGLVIRCGDGSWRRLFPRLFAYSADYVERYVSSSNLNAFDETQALPLSDRVLIACIKSNGKHLCATCTTTHNQVLHLGTKLHDQIWASRKRVDSKDEQSRVEAARRKIYQHGYVADGKAIDDILHDSKTPIRVSLPCGYPLGGDQLISILPVERL